jgi:hypothetical protein
VMELVESPSTAPSSPTRTSSSSTPRKLMVFRQGRTAPDDLAEFSF